MECKDRDIFGKRIRLRIRLRLRFLNLNLNLNLTRCNNMSEKLS